VSVPIIAAARSPFAAADGVLARWHPVELAAVVMNATLARAGIDADDVDLVVAGCAEPVGAQGANAAHACTLAAGWRASIPGFVVDAETASGIAALTVAHDALVAGRARTAVVIGLNSASVVQPGASALGRIYGRPWGSAVEQRYAGLGGLVPPITAADRLAIARGIDRARQDAWGLRSLDRRSTPNAALVTVGARPGESVAVQRDVPISEDVLRTIKIDELEPIFERDGTTTAAGFAPAADGVAVMVLSTTAATESLGVLESAALGLGDPTDPLGGLDIARRTMLRSSDSWTIAEPSASTTLLAVAELGIDESIVNRHGGTIAVGDAGAGEDLRLVIDGLHAAETSERGAALRCGGGTAGISYWQRS
jgi:acetyl-CoA acetyltransferase